MTKKIFVIEDDENIREMIKMALVSFSYEVLVFENAENAFSESLKDVPDMFIFDIMLPGMSGIEATKKIRENSLTKKVPVIMLTAKDTEIDKVLGFDCGADDYITKPFSVLELGARIRSIFRRTDKEDKIIMKTIQVSDLNINNETREVFKNGELIELTFKEYELLYMLVGENTRIISREELLNTIWGEDFLGESRTLDIHIRTLRQKLGDNAENPKYIKTVRNVGYRFIG